MKRFDTLGMRMTLVVAAVLLALTAFARFTFPETLERVAVSRLQSESKVVARGEARQLVSLVEADERLELQKRLEWIAEREQFGYLQLYLANGAMVGSAGPRRFEAIDLWWRGDRFAYADDIYQFSVPIPPGGPGQGELGELRVGVPLSVVTADLRRYSRSLAYGSGALLLVGVLAVFLVSHRVGRPLREMADTADRIARGELDDRVDPGSMAEAQDLAVAFNRMVDELVRARLELQSEKDRAEAILDAIPAPVAVFDEELRCDYINPGALPDPDRRRQAIGLRPDALLDAGEAGGVDAHTSARIASAVEDAVHLGRVVTVEAAVEVAGESRTFLYMAAPMPAEPGYDRPRVIGYGVDVTDWRRAEAALEESEAQLLQAQKMEAIGRLAGGVAHDFNNLLTAIAGHAELLLDRSGRNAADREDLDQIQDATRRATRLTRQLLTFSRKQNSEPRPTSLNAGVRGIEPMLRRLIPPRIVLETQLCHDDPFVLVDHGRVEQVVMNLALNAADAMPDVGRLTITTRFDPLDADTPIRLTVADTGTGIPEELLPKIFDPFFTTKDPGKGTGLGLATAYGIVTSAGGRIDVATRQGSGTTFQIHLPAAEAPADQHADPHGTAAPVAPPAAGGCGSVLVVDDQEPVRRFVARALCRSGFTVHEADGPDQALDLVAEGLQPDALLSDIQMPGLEGPQLAERIREHRPGIPVLFMSGLGADEIRWSSEDRSAFIQKPFTADDLAASLRLLLEQSHPTAGR